MPGAVAGGRQVHPGERAGEGTGGCCDADSYSPDRREEGADVVDEQLRLLEGGEVPTARHRGPVRDVVDRLAPRAHRSEHFAREMGYARRQFDPIKVAPRLEAFPVQASR